MTVEQAARRMGLTVHAAKTLDTVTVEGPSSKVLELLREIDVQTVILDKSMNLPALPKPKKLAAR